MSLVPDSKTVAAVRASPNHELRRRPIDILLLHYTGMATAESALERLCSAEAKVSSHYVVEEDGRVSQLVAEAHRAFHAGVSSWEGETDINSRSIGIEIVNGGLDFGSPDFPAAQIAGVIALCRDIVARHAIRADRVLAHSDVAPSRKNDPGEKFPWRTLAEAGVGLWVAPADITEGPALAAGDRGESVARLQRALERYGYGVPTAGTFDDITHDVVVAFQRHFRPAKVDGAADLSTRATLDALLAAREKLIA